MTPNMKIGDKTHKIISICSMLLVMTFMCSCIEEIDFNPETTEDICFSAQLESDVTKGTPINTFTKDTKAGVIGYAGLGSGENLTYSLWDILDGRIFKFDGDQMDADGEPVKWKDLPQNTTKLRVYSYIPDTTPITKGQSSPTIVYQISEDVSKQVDLITAYKEVPASNKERITLNFTHALTAIQFKSGFSCRVKSITVSDVFNKGIYNFETGSWNTTNQTKGTFTIDLDGDLDTKGMEVNKGDMITFGDPGTVLLMIPQSFDSQTQAKISLTYYVGNSNTETKTISTLLTGASWKAGDMITYTLNERQQDTQEYIYFDLSAGNVTINGSNFSGSVYINNGAAIETFTGTHNSNNKYYVYQSTAANKSSTGWSGERGSSTFTLPNYDPVTYNGQLWSDWITNNQSVEDVIEIWDDGHYIRDNHDNAPNENHIGIARVRDVGRTHTFNYITVTGSNTNFNIVIDNIYSVIQERVKYSQQTFRNRQKGGISYMPSGNTTLTVNLIGDNRMGCLHIDNNQSDKIIIEGKGSLTVASTDFITVESETNYAKDFGASTGYISNFWNSAIGTNTYSTSTEPLYNLHINGGIIFAGTTAAEDCTAIGGGGNGLGQVFINGGTVTAVATTAGTAIGGGMGHSAEGGPGEVTISGGNVYAYNFRNIWGIPSSAIGGGGSYSAQASYGTVNISGGYVYAHSVLGTAIGGGSSKNISGGNATINISGGHIVAKSEEACGIGGGTGGFNQGVNGGSARINISGNPIIRTGSIGGGKTNNSTGKIGHANITVSGGDIQAQFVMAAGAADTPSFTMTGGLIRNSSTSEQNDDPEFPHTQHKGGAVYLEAGTFTMSGGEIRNCISDAGGAIYIKGKESVQGQENETKFILSGDGKITECVSNTSGGAVYLENGSVYLKGGEISGNLAKAGNGGGICIVGGNLYMQEQESKFTTIKNNAAFGGSGGGVYVSSTTDDVIVNLHRGTIQANSADKYGGGVCVDMGGVYDDDSSTINDSQSPKAMVEVGSGNVGPDIVFNHSTLKGGGLYASGTDANITINAGSIKDNTVSGYVDNPNVANEGGMVTLNGEEVTTYVTVTYNNNFEYHNQSGVQIATQKIVTNTNTKMIAPADWFSPGYLLGYTLREWNTRPDGKGTSYSTGATMKLSADITLYAQWTR